MSIGSDLRQAREQHGLTLGELSTRTKIRVPVLRAIEGDDFDHVPGGVITRGFLKLYAREVGLDPDEIARRFNALRAEALETQARSDDAGGPSHAAPRRPSGTAAGSFFSAVAVIAGLVILGGGYLAWSRTGRAAQPTSAASSAAEKPLPPVAGPPAAPPTKQAAPTVAAVATAGAPTDAAPAAAGAPTGAAPAADGALRVDVRATEASWLAATADGAQVAFRMLNAGDQVSLSVKSLGVLRIGIPANVTVTINGTPVKPFGIPGNPATLRITPDNYKTLLP